MGEKFKLLSFKMFGDLKTEIHQAVSPYVEWLYDRNDSVQMLVNEEMSLNAKHSIDVKIGAHRFFSIGIHCSCTVWVIFCSKHDDLV